MEYSDAENLCWWQRLTRGDRDALLEKIWERAKFDSVKTLVCRAKDCQNAGVTPSPRDLRDLRRWDQ